MLRQYQRVVFPTLWAEDGAIFLSRTIMEGFHAIFQTYAGYLQVLPQIISLASYRSISLKYYPILTLAVCSYIYAYTFSLITRPSYAWIHEDFKIRLLIAISLTLIPGTPEVLGNLAKLHTVLIFFLFFNIT